MNDLDPEQLVQRLTDAYNQGDPDAFCACFAHDAQLCDFPSTLLRQGRAQIREGYARLFTRHPDARCEVVLRERMGRRVIDHQRVHGLGPAPHRSVAIYETRDGLITQLWFIR